MKFEKYPSLVRSDAAAKGSKLNKYLEDNVEEWYATEKIHGCNFALYYDGQQLRYAKRTSFLNKDDELFNWQEYFLTPDALLSDWRTSVIKMWENMLSDNKDFEHLVIFGEFFGGDIQDSVQYKQTVEDTKEYKIFNVFAYKGSNTYKILSRTEMEQHLPAHLLTPLVATGQFWEVLRELDMEAESTFGGISEGYVLQPNITREWKTGEVFLGVKHKTHHFTEIEPYHLTNLIGSAATLHDLKRYLTANRLDSIASKGYTMKRENMAELMDILIADVYEDYDEPLTDGDKESYKNQLRKNMAHLILTWIKHKDNLARKDG